MIIGLEDGTKIITERNQRVVLKVYNPRNSNSCVSSTVPANRTLNDFISRAVNAQGSEIWRYDAIKNNCQDYLTTLLSANGLPTQASFIKQDTKGLLSPFLQGVAKKITDAAAVAELVVKGGKRKEKISILV